MAISRRLEPVEPSSEVRCLLPGCRRRATWRSTAVREAVYWDVEAEAEVASPQVSTAHWCDLHKGPEYGA